MDKPYEKKDGDTQDVLPIEGVTPDKYIPEGFESKEAFLADMRAEYQADVDFDRINREQALDDKKFAAGEQWDPIVLEQRKGLPCLVINSIPQFTAQLVGDWRESRKAIKVIPSNDEDTDVATIRGDIIRSIEAQSRAQRVYDSAFESLVQCGDGAFRISVEYAKDDVFDQDIFIRPIEDALAVVWDRYSVDPTGRDAKRVYVNDRIPKNEFDKKWPGKTPDSLEGDDALTKISVNGWVDSDSYQITEYWRLVERQRLLALFENGKTFMLEDDNMEKLIAENGPPIRTRASWCSYAQMHLVTGFEILSGPYEYKLNRVPIIRMSGRIVNVGGRRVRYGLVRNMKDSVRLKNFWRSVAAEQLGYAPKAKWIAPESAVEGREDTFRKAHLSRDPLLVYNDGAEAPPVLIPPPPVEASLLNEAATNAQDIKDVTGIHDASLGVRSNETSGRAIMARQREGDIANLTFHDNGDAAVLEGGDVINQLIPQVIDGTRVVRLLGEDEVEKFARVNDPMDPNAVDLSVGEFDVALSTGTSYTTKRVEAAQAMMDAIQVWPQLMTVAGDLVAKAQDWPGAEKLAERLKKTIPPQFLDEDEEGAMGITPEQLQEMQQQLEQLAMENQTLKMEKYNKEVEHEIALYNAETQRIRALSDHEVDAQQQSLQAIGMILDNTATADEQDIKRADSEVKRMAAANKPTPATQRKATSRPYNQ
jgi:Phage P22-like portal protein